MGSHEKVLYFNRAVVVSIVDETNGSSPHQLPSLLSFLPNLQQFCL